MKHETNVGTIAYRSNGTFRDIQSGYMVQYVENSRGQTFKEFNLADLDNTVEHQDDLKAYVKVFSHEHKPDPHNENIPGNPLRWISMKYPYVRSRVIWDKNGKNAIFRWSPTLAAMPGFYEGISQELADEVIAEEKGNTITAEQFIQPIVVVSGLVGVTEVTPSKKKVSTTKALT